jgi:hypothetical protein
MKTTAAAARIAEAACGLERIKRLGEHLASAPVNSREHRVLSAAMRVEADAYRKSLDTEQATAAHDAQPRPKIGLRWRQLPHGKADLSQRRSRVSR